MTGTFNATSSDKTGYDMVLESAFNLDSYDVRLKLTSGGYSSTHRVNFSDWTLDTLCSIEYLTPLCLRGGPFSTQRYYLALDFDADFNLNSTDTIEGRCLQNGFHDKFHHLLLKEGGPFRTKPK